MAWKAMISPKQALALAREAVADPNVSPRLIPHLWENIRLLPRGASSDAAGLR
jgi:hypothetical protein